MQPVITLISDWKLRDPYLALFKGRLLRVFQNVNILDITHSIERENFHQTAFILKNSFLFFPEKSIHLILTNLNLAKTTRPILMEWRDHLFIADNQHVLSLILSFGEKAKAFVYSQEETSICHEKIIKLLAWHFSERSNSLNVEENVITGSLTLDMLRYSESEQQLTGTIVYVDSKCNAITNIPTEMFLSYFRNRKFQSKIKNIPIEEFAENKIGEGSIYFSPNILGFIELKMNGSALAALLDLRIGETITIKNMI